MGSTARVSSPAKPCSSNVERRLSITCCSTMRWAGSSSGNPLSGVGLLMSSLSEAPGRHARRVRAASHIEQERVADALAPDGGLLTVAGEHHDVVGQGEHLVAQAA